MKQIRRLCQQAGRGSYHWYEEQDRAVTDNHIHCELFAEDYIWVWLWDSNVEPSRMLVKLRFVLSNLSSFSIKSVLLLTNEEITF